MVDAASGSAPAIGESRRDPATGLAARVLGLTRELAREVGGSRAAAGVTAAASLEGDLGV